MAGGWEKVHLLKVSMMLLSLYLHSKCLYLKLFPFQPFLCPLCFTNCLLWVFPLWLHTELPFLFWYLMIISPPLWNLKVSVISLLRLSATFMPGGFVPSLKSLSCLGFHSSDPSLFTWWLSEHFVYMTFFSSGDYHGSPPLECLRNYIRKQGQILSMPAF